MFEEKNDINYVKIAFAVCGGILMAGLIMTVIGLFVMNAVVDTQVAAINGQAEDFKRQMQEVATNANRSAAQHQKQQQLATEQQRIKSKIGQTLSRECSEYSQFYRDNPSSYAKKERDKACSKYRGYISTGKT